MRLLAQAAPEDALEALARIFLAQGGSRSDLRSLVRRVLSRLRAG